MTLDDLAVECLNTRWSPEYRERMIHSIPDAPVVDREAYIVKACKGKRILNLGSNGTDGESLLHKSIKAVALSSVGVDREKSDWDCDLDSTPQDLLAITCDPIRARPFHPDLIVVGEILEHLG